MPENRSEPPHASLSFANFQSKVNKRSHDEYAPEAQGNGGNHASHTSLGRRRLFLRESDSERRSSATPQPCATSEKMSSLSTPKNAEPTIFDSEVLSSKLQLCMLHGNASTSPKFMKHVNFSNQRNTCDSATRAKEGEQMRLFAQPFLVPPRTGLHSAAARRRAQRQRQQE